ncbi:autotransporter outer membrane beta-barrel domain-containing protein, partial [Achromobacter sp. SIMBA_011]
ARGSVSGYNVGVYGTWYGSRDILSGPYADAWFMYGAYANSVGGSLAADSYRSRTVTGSLEAGYSLPFYERGDSRFFVEP